jgi:hypothetical protein
MGSYPASLCASAPLRELIWLRPEAALGRHGVGEGLFVRSEGVPPVRREAIWASLCQAMMRPLRPKRQGQDALATK